PGSIIRAPAGSPARAPMNVMSASEGWHKHSAKAESGEACNHQRGCVTDPIDQYAVEDILSAHRNGLLLALCIGVNLALGQNAGAAPDSNPIGKVLTTTGTIRIEHSATILAQANLPTDVGQAKVGDFVYRGDIIQTGPDGKLGVAFADGSS